MSNFDRVAALPRGHKNYTAAKTLKEWGSFGPRASGAWESYDSRSWRVTRPPEGVSWDEYNPLRIGRVGMPDLPSRQPEADLVEVPEYWLDGRVCRFPGRYTNPAKRFATPPKGHQASPLKRSGVLRMANDGPTPEWLAQRDAAGYATKTDRTVPRIEAALVKAKSPLIITLRRVKELLRPASLVAANDNEAEEADNESDKRDSGFERKHDQSNILPSVPMLLRACADGLRPRVVIDKRGKLHRYPGGHTFVGDSENDEWHLIGTTDHKRKLSGLIFMNGKLIAYGDYKGRRQKPDYLLGVVTEAVADIDSETAGHIAAQPAENENHIMHLGTGMRAGIAPVDRLGDGRSIPRPHCNDNNLGAGMPAQKLPAGVAAEYGRLAGVSEAKGVGKGKTSAARHHVLDELDRAARLADVDLSEDDVEIVEEVLADYSYTRIAMDRGYAQLSAHKSGKRLVEAALQRISEKVAA